MCVWYTDIKGLPNLTQAGCHLQQCHNEQAARSGPLCHHLRTGHCISVLKSFCTDTYGARTCYELG